MQRKKRKNDEKEGSYLHKAGIVLISVLMMFSVLTVFGATETVEAGELNITHIEHLSGGDDDINGFIEFHPDGDYFLVADYDGNLYKYDTNYYSEEVVFSITGKLTEVDFSPDGDEVAVAEREDGGVYFLDTSDWSENKHVNIEGVADCYSLEWSPDGEFVAVSDMTDEVHLINPSDYTVFESLSAGDDWSMNVAINENGKVFTRYDSDDVAVYTEGDDGDWVIEETLIDPDDLIRGIDVSDEYVGAFVGIDDDNHYYIWDSDTYNLEHYGGDYAKRFSHFSNSGDYLGIIYSEGDVVDEVGNKILETETWDMLDEFSTNEEIQTRTNSWSPDDSLYVTGGAGGINVYETGLGVDDMDVETVGYSDITEDTATLEGELTKLEEYDEVESYFEYRPESIDGELLEDGTYEHRDRPHAMEYNDALYIAYIDSTGDQRISKYDYDTDEWSHSPVLESTDSDSHIAPVFFFRDDGTIQIFVDIHSSAYEDEYIRWRTSDNPEDVTSFSSTQSYELLNGYDTGRSFSVQKLDNGDVALQINIRPQGTDNRVETLSISDDDGETWDTDVMTDLDGEREYATMWVDDSYIHMIHTHRHDDADTSTERFHEGVYYSYFDVVEESYYEADGTHIRDWGDNEINDPTDLDVIWHHEYDQEDDESGHWLGGNIITDEEGNPYVTFVTCVFEGPASSPDALDIQGHWASLDANDEWEYEHVTQLGHGIASSIPGGIMMLENEPETLYLQNVEEDSYGDARIERWERNGGDWESIKSYTEWTSNERSDTDRNMLPFPVYNADLADGRYDFIYLHGWFGDSLSSYDTDIHGVDATTNNGDWQMTTPETMTSTGTFSHSIDNLDPDTTYEFRAVVQTPDGNELDTGDTMTFTTSTGDDDDDAPLITDPEDYDGWTEWLMDNPLLVVLAVVFVILISRMASDEG